VPGLKLLALLVQKARFWQRFWAKLS